MSFDLNLVPRDRIRVLGSDRGRDVHEVVLRSPTGMEARVMTYGAIIRDLTLPNPGGGRQSMVLGYDSLDRYLTDPNYFGAIVGRFANRIAGGRFTLDGTIYELDRNERETTLHGGSAGFSTKLWAIRELTETSVTLVLVSPDGDQGFPGELTATCRYSLSDELGLSVSLTATTTRATPVSLAQHSYFTLGAPDVRELQLTVFAGHYTPVDDTRIPTGRIAAVDGTPFDFRWRRPVGEVAGGLDHNFVLPPPERPEGLRLAALLQNAATGLQLEAYTTKPGLQVYDGAMIRLGGPAGRAGAYSGICLETQAFPDSPNQPGFPSAILRPGDVYRNLTVYRFRSQGDPRKRQKPT